jgi:hypothetical protein
VLGQWVGAIVPGLKGIFSPVLGLKPRASYMLGKCSVAELGFFKK